MQGSEPSAVNGNRLCLDFANLPFTPGDPLAHQTSWLELIDFLADNRIISGARSAELSSLTQSDPRAAGILMKQAERLGDSLRLAFAAMASGADVKPEWVAPVNVLLEITEGHDQLQREQGRWRLGFR